MLYRCKYSDFVKYYNVQVGQNYKVDLIPLYSPNTAIIYYKGINSEKKFACSYDIFKKSFESLSEYRNRIVNILLCSND